jgi:hypothetical protein
MAGSEAWFEELKVRMQIEIHEVPSEMGQFPLSLFLFLFTL